MLLVAVRQRLFRRRGNIHLRGRLGSIHGAEEHNQHGDRKRHLHVETDRDASARVAGYDDALVWILTRLRSTLFNVGLPTLIIVRASSVCSIFRIS